MHCRSMHRQLHQLRSRRKCQTRLVQELLAAGRDTTKTMVWLYSSTLENPNSAGKILTGHGRGMCGSASHASAALEQLNRSCESLFFFCASFTCRTEVHCMDLICHWGQQEDLESPQVARLPQKSLVKVPKFYEFYRILTLQVMKPMKPNATWKRWNNIHLVESVECFLFVTICFFWSGYQLWLDHLDSFRFHVITLSPSEASSLQQVLEVGTGPSGKRVKVHAASGEEGSECRSLSPPVGSPLSLLFLLLFISFPEKTLKSQCCSSTVLGFFLV